MPFGVVSRIGQGMGVLDGMEIVEGKSQFWGKREASRCNQGTLWRSYSLP